MRYSSWLNELLPTDRLCALGPGTPDEAFRPKLAALSSEQLFAGQRITDHDAARCCLSGLWLLHDCLEESHTISQDIETVDGSYWHALMHRREPDYFNSKYWFRRVGNHAIFPQLLEVASELINVNAPVGLIGLELSRGTSWDPFRFVDWCEHVTQVGGKRELVVQQIAMAEWRLLFDHCYRAAII